MTSPDKATVFIVDDDDRMRAATQRLLNMVGQNMISLLTRNEIHRDQI